MLAARLAMYGRLRCQLLRLLRVCRLALPLRAALHGVSGGRATIDQRRLLRRAALGDNPTQEEMDAVVAYGLEQHRINFPEFYT